MSTIEVITLSDSDSDDTTTMVFAVSSGEDSDLDSDVVFVASTQLPQSSLRKSPTRTLPMSNNGKLPINRGSTFSLGASSSTSHQKQKQPLNGTIQPTTNRTSQHQLHVRCTTPILTGLDDDDGNNSACGSEDTLQHGVTCLDLASGVGLFPLPAARSPSSPVARFWDVVFTVTSTKH